MKSKCGLCGKTVELPHDGKLPPWCPNCGVDLKSCPLQMAVANAPAGSSPEDEQEWKERFGKHNLVVGILLFVWGTIVSAAPPQSGGDKVLRAQTRLNAVIDVAQVASLLNGIALAASGLALRRGWAWGYPLGIFCGIVLVIVGFTFLAGYQYLGGGKTLEEGVARLSFVRYNLDMLIGLVDGLGLIWFITTRFPRSKTATPS